jgi:hypothetical protein
MAMQRNSEVESYIEVYEKLIAIPDLANTVEEKLDVILRFAMRKRDQPVPSS